MMLCRKSVPKSWSNQLTHETSKRILLKSRSWIKDVSLGKFAAFEHRDACLQAFQLRNTSCKQSHGNFCDVTLKNSQDKISFTEKKLSNPFFFLLFLFFSSPLDDGDVVGGGS